MGDSFDFGFSESQAIYTSGSQSARVWTENWVLRELFCPSCGDFALRDLPNNAPVADFDCENCLEQFELKASKSAFGKKVVDGAFFTMIERLNSACVPHLMLLRYDRDRRCVEDVEVVPKHFFVPDIIEKRPPLAPTARRAGWVGCNIRLDMIPAAGRIDLIRHQIAQPIETVLDAWQRTEFLREKSATSRTWLMDVLNCVEQIGSREFSLASVYEFEPTLSQRHPGNQNIRPKIRQQLQVLRDEGVLEFLGRGRYRLR